jgi:hypothetical protein
LVKDGQKIERGDKLFDWDPFTLPLIAEKAGTAKFVDLVSGIAVRDETDDATGMTQKIVTDWRAAPKGNELAPKIIITGDETQIDLPKNQHSGLSHAKDILKSIKGISFVHLDSKDIIRNKLVGEIIKAYKKND